MLTVSGLYKKFPSVDGTRQLFSNLSLELEAGKFNVLLGRNGSGKSTLLRIIAGELVPDGGEVLLDGKGLSGRSGTRQRICLIRQSRNENLVPSLTVSELLALAQ